MRMAMDFVKLMNEIRVKNNFEVQQIARSYGVFLSIQEIEALRPLLDEVSFHWLFTGIPNQFLRKVSDAIGEEKAEELFQMYFDATN
jgi:hypothetical protein